MIAPIDPAFWSKVRVRPGRARPKLSLPLFHEIDRLEATRGPLDNVDRPDPVAKTAPKKREKKGPTL